jgi:hypothetical protein
MIWHTRLFWSFVLRNSSVNLLYSLLQMDHLLISALWGWGGWRKVLVWPQSLTSWRPLEALLCPCIIFKVSVANFWTIFFCKIFCQSHYSLRVFISKASSVTTTCTLLKYIVVSVLSTRKLCWFINWQRFPDLYRIE